ncbi:hypothetical protein DRQ53_13780 [bacterium]|nr:MAG: hypothetical protein DRQ53_13780 [bacterium]
MNPGHGEAPYIDGVMGELARDLDFEDVLIELLDEVDPSVLDEVNWTNEKAAVFWDLVEDSGRAGDLDVADVARMDAAVLADDLSLTLEKYKGGDAMAAHRATKEMRERLQSYDNALEASSQNMPDTREVRQARHIAEDMRTRTEGQIDQWRKSRERLMETVNDKYTAVMPARFRAPAMMARQSVRGLIDLADEAFAAKNYELASTYGRMTEDLPTTMQMLVDEGTTDPLHLIGGDEASLGRAGGGASTGGGQVRGGSQLKHGFRTLDPVEYARVEASEMVGLIRDKAVNEMVNDPNFSKLSADVPAVKAALDDHRARFGRDMGRSDYDRVLRDNGYGRVGYGGKPPTDAVQGPGGARALDTEFRGSQAGPGEVAAVTGRPPYMSERIMPLSFINEMSEMRVGTNKYATMYDQMNQMWKTPVLAWSPAWLVNNLVGNAFMAMAGGGMTPAQLIREMRAISKATKEATGKSGIRAALTGEGTLPAHAPDALGSHGLTFDEQRFARQLSDRDTRLGRVLSQMGDGSVSKIGFGKKGETGSRRINLGRATEVSYALNEFTDNMFRTAVHNKKLFDGAPTIPKDLLDVDGAFKYELTVSSDEIARLKRLANGPDSLGARVAGEKLDRIESVKSEHGAKYDNIVDEVRIADDKAVKAALNVMGDFTRMTRFERNYIKRVIPFYAWMRHQTQAAIRLSISSPLRAAWLSSLADVLGDDMGDDERDLFGMSVDVGGYNLNFASMMPYAPLSQVAGNVANPRTALRSISPVVKEPLRFFTGFDVGSMDISSRPTEQQNIGIFGQAENTPGISRFFDDPIHTLGEIGYSALGTVPQARGIRDLALGRGQVRYDSGDRVAGGRYDRGVPLISQLAQIVRSPINPQNRQDLREQLQLQDQSR